MDHSSEANEHLNPDHRASVSIADAQNHGRNNVSSLDDVLAGGVLDAGPSPTPPLGASSNNAPNALTGLSAMTDVTRGANQLDSPPIPSPTPGLSLFSSATNEATPHGQQRAHPFDPQNTSHSLLMQEPIVEQQQQFQPSTQAPELPLDTKKPESKSTEKKSTSSKQARQSSKSSKSKKKKASTKKSDTSSSPTTRKGRPAAASTSAARATEDRNWRVIQYDKHPEVDEALRVEINLSIRGEDASCFVPDRLYCSHRYKVHHRIISSSLPQKVPLLLSRLQIVDPETEEEILSKKTGKPIVKGDFESACTLSEEGFTCKMRIQFTESCYRYNRQDFQLMIHYCDPNDKEDPLFSLMSPRLKIYARKPSTPISTLSKEYKPNKKRKRKKSQESKPSKKQKSAASESTKRKTKKRKKTSAEADVWITPNNSPVKLTGKESTANDASPSNTQVSVPSSHPGEIQQQSFREPQKRTEKRTAGPQRVYDQFSEKLQRLASLQQRMSPEQRSRIHNHVLDRLLREDPDQLVQNSMRSSKEDIHNFDLLC